MDLSDLAALGPTPPTPSPFPSENTYRWATVTQTSPLRVRLDGDISALPVTPDTLESGLAVDDRVWVQFFGRRLIVLGRGGAGGPVGGGGWIGLTLSGAWVAYGGDYHAPEYRIESGGRVWLRGAVKSGAVGTIAVMPAGTWPSKQQNFIVYASGGSARVEIDFDGSLDLKAYTGGTNTLVSLDDISWDPS